MLHFLFLLSYLRSFLRSRHHLGLEVLALRQQLAVLKRKHPRPQLRRADRLFWIALSTLWARWSDALILVKPDTVARWHRAGFASSGVCVSASAVVSSMPLSSK